MKAPPCLLHAHALNVAMSPVEHEEEEILSRGTASHDCDALFTETNHTLITERLRTTLVTNQPTGTSLSPESV